MTSHSKAATVFQQNKAQAVWHDATFWGMREKRDRMARSVPEWERLRSAAAQIKDYSLSHLPELLEQFEAQAKANGAVVHWAKDAEEYRQTVLKILEDHQVKHFIKSKSMLSEECELDPFLISHGIDTVESDLGERILQLLHLRPSHVVVPALHVKKEQVGELFVREMGAEPGNNDPTYLTHVARRAMRPLYLHAQACMTGANFAVAETGECVVCTNEGNADLGASLCRLQITAFGIDKIVPTTQSLSVFTRLLSRSATGQLLTSYTAHHRKPQRGGELHIIIVDNGRAARLADAAHRKTLRCIRCGACMNTCPVYRRSGGYSYSYFIPGPIGINLGMSADAKQYKGNLSACTLCHSCQDVCPVKIDLADQIYLWRQQAYEMGIASQEKHLLSKSMQGLMDHPHIFNTAMDVAPLLCHAPSVLIPPNGWTAERELPEFQTPSFNTWWKNQKKKNHE